MPVKRRIAGQGLPDGDSARRLPAGTGRLRRVSGSVVEGGPASVSTNQGQPVDRGRGHRRRGSSSRASGIPVGRRPTLDAGVRTSSSSRGKSSGGRAEVIAAPMGGGRRVVRVPSKPTRTAGLGDDRETSILEQCPLQPNTSTRMASVLNEESDRRAVSHNVSHAGETGRDDSGDPERDRLARELQQELARQAVAETFLGLWREALDNLNPDSSRLQAQMTALRPWQAGGITPLDFLDVMEARHHVRDFWEDSGVLDRQDFFEALGRASCSAESGLSEARTHYNKAVKLWRSRYQTAVEDDDEPALMALDLIAEDLHRARVALEIMASRFNETK